MVVQQMAELLNTITTEVIGEEAVVAEDLSNIVDLGASLFDNTSVDNYVRMLIDRIGKVVCVNRIYTMPYPDVMREAWEYGSVMQKIRAELPDAEDNPSWGLQRGDTPNQFEFNPPTVVQKFFNQKSSFEIQMSFTELQVKESFTSRTSMMSFISMIENAIQTSMTIKTTSVAQRAINHFIVSKINANNGIVNLLTMYNGSHPGQTTPLTAETCRFNADFLRYAAMTIAMYRKRLSYASVLFNVGDIPTFTPDEYLRFVLNDEFAKAINVYMTSDTYHDDLVSLDGFKTIPYWQGTGESYAFADTTKIIAQANGSEEATTASYVVGVMFDRDAIMVCNENYRVTSAYNARGEYINNFYKYDISIFNDLNENGIVFRLA